MSIINEIKKLENEINEILYHNNVIVKIIEDANMNKGKIKIFKNNKLAREYEIEAISSCQVKILHGDNILEDGLFIDDIGKWLYNLYNSIQYLYSFYGGELNFLILTKEQVNEKAIGMTKNLQVEREQGLLVQRKELDNQPIVKGYLGPMLDKIDYGKVYLRYETVI